jgi:hypothetical protein
LPLATQELADEGDADAEADGHLGVVRPGLGAGLRNTLS